MSSFHLSPFSPHHPEHPAATATPAFLSPSTRSPDASAAFTSSFGPSSSLGLGGGGGFGAHLTFDHPSEELDMTSANDRYKIRACYTILHQINALLREIKANPHAEVVPEDYVPYRSLGDDDSIVPVEITTPRPLKRPDAFSPSRTNAAVPRTGSDLFSDLDGDQGVIPSVPNVDFREDGRLTALNAISSAAVHDPRFATIQGLLQHLDQIALEGIDPEHPATSYPSWLAPQLGQLFGMINTMFPTEARRRHDLQADQEAVKFKWQQAALAKEEMDAKRFDMFLTKNLEEARRRAGQLQQLQELQQQAPASPSRPTQPAQFDSPSSKSPSKTKQPTILATGGHIDTFAMMSSLEAEHNLARRTEKRAEMLRQLSPASRKVFLLAEKRALAERGGSDLRDIKLRPQHEKPFGYSSHKKKKIGDPLEPVTRNKKYDSKPRKVPGLLEPRKKYGISVTHPKPGEEEYEQRRQQRQMERAEQQDDDQPQSDVEPVEDDQIESEDPQQSYAYQQQPSANDDDDPFAVHDPDASPPTTQRRTSSAAANQPRSTGAPRQKSVKQARRPTVETEDHDDDPFAVHQERRADEEEKEQSPLERYRPPALVSEDEDDQPAAAEDDDDPFSAHDPSSSALPKKRPLASSASSSSVLYNLPTPSTVQRLMQPTPAASKRSSMKTLPEMPPSKSQRSSRPPSATPSRSASKKSLKSGPPSARRSLVSTPSTASRKSITRQPSASDPFAAMDESSAFKSKKDLARTLATNSAGEEADPKTWQDIELKLVAMHEELKENTSQQVNSALKRLSDTLQDGGELLTPSESGDMSTLVFDSALHDMLAKGKRIVKSESLRSLNSPLAVMSQTQSTLELANVLTQEQLRTQQQNARLEQEKKELELALKELQERDAQHAKSLYLLMDKLNSLHKPSTLSATASLLTRTGMMSPARQRAQLKTAAFIEPFGTPPSNFASLPNSPGTRPPSVLGTSLKKPNFSASRSVRPIQSPTEIGREVDHEESFVEGLPDVDASIQLNSSFAPPPTDEEQLLLDQESRMEELQSELEQAQLLNATMKARLDEATIQSQVLTKTSEQQKLFMAQQMLHQSESERLKEQSRQDLNMKQHQEDLRRIQATERQIQDIKEEQRMLRAKFDSDRTALESNVTKLLSELDEHTEAEQRYKSEANLMRARYEQIVKEQEEMQSQMGGGKKSWQQGGGGPNGGSGNDVLQNDFFNFLASSFRGDYLRVVQNVTLTHTLEQQAHLACSKKEQTCEHEQVLFSDYITKYNRRNSGQQRILLLTSTAIYFLLPKTYELRRRIPLADLKSLSLSRLCTDLLVLHHSNLAEADCLFTSPKRSELIYHLQAAYKKLSSFGVKLVDPHLTSLPYEFSERLYVRDLNHQMRDVQILDSQSFKLGKPMQVHSLAYHHISNTKQ